MAALHALEAGLRLAVFGTDVTATRAGSAGVVRWHCHQHPPVPSQFVFELPSELEPALIQDGFVQARLGTNIFSWRICRTRCRLGHVFDLQGLDAHHRVVLADRGRGFVQVVFAAISNAGVQTLNFGFRLFPVAAEFLFTAHRPLVAAQSDFMALEAGQWCKKVAIGERCKAGNAHVDAHC